MTTARPAPRSLEDALALRRAPGIRRLAWIVMGLLGGFVLWSVFAPLDEVSVAEGEVAPKGKVKVIQHLEGGLITGIFIHEGDLVHPGAPLMQLDLATSGVNRDEMQVRIDGLQLSLARLVAEATGSELAFPEAIAARRPQLAAAETDTFMARRDELNATLSVLREQVKQRESEVGELEARQTATGNNLRLAREKLRMSASLLSDGLTARMDHMQLQSETEDLQGQAAVLAQSVPRARAALAEGRERLREETLRFRREAKEQLTEVKLNLARNVELLEKATDQQNRTEIRSPIEGVVKNMRYNTIGGVIKAGEPILDIVPSKDNMVVEARLAPVDRGYVREGQDATIKISTFDYARYGGLQGKVVLVAPDSTTPEQAAPYFRVLVEPQKNYLGDRPGQYVITPGMQATVDIHTGKRSVLDYLIRPVLKIKHEAFRER
jgi:adhesin transport system membrane fusion protein